MSCWDVDMNFFPQQYQKVENPPKQHQNHVIKSNMNQIMDVCLCVIKL